MVRLCDLTPATLGPLNLRKEPKCAVLAKKLYAGALEGGWITKKPEEIARSVLELNGTGLTAYERKQLPYLLLQADYDEYHPAFAREVFRNYVKNNRFWGRLFQSWLLAYDLERPGSALVISELRQNTGRLAEPFQNLVGRYPILSKSPDFGDAARSILNNEMPLEDRSALGLNEAGVVSTGIARKILIACAQRLKNGLATEPQLRNFREIVAPDGNIHESVKEVAMVGLVLGSHERQPGDNLIKEISSLIEGNFDDPVAGKNKWPAVPNELGGPSTRERCLEIVQKWQVFRAITLFFKIIDEVVEKSEHKHHFPQRRDFWLGYFDKGQVTEARVVLGPKARDRMEKIVREGGDDYATLKWSSLKECPKDQCALLMKIGDATVMEFSHSGRVRMWGRSDGSGDVTSGVPVLDRKEYKAKELRANCPDSQMFTHDKGGNWKYPARRCIEKLTGVATKL